MKLNKKIAMLDVRKHVVAFPRWDTNWLNFVSLLKDVLAENGLGRNWEFSEHDQVFFSSWHEGAAVFTQRSTQAFHGGFTLNVQLNPMLPLADEISRLIKDHDDFKSICASSAYLFEQGQKGVLDVRLAVTNVEGS